MGHKERRAIFATIEASQHLLFSASSPTFRFPSALHRKRHSTCTKSQLAYGWRVT